MKKEMKPAHCYFDRSIRIKDMATEKNQTFSEKKMQDERFNRKTKHLVARMKI